jgi:hypothetical protein
MMADVIFSYIGQIVLAGGGGALIAYLVFQFLGKSWIQNQLAKDLELAKSEISLLTARRMKLHDREYVVFPEIWSKLHKSSESLERAISAFKEFPDLNRMSQLEFAKWLERAELPEAHRDYLTVEKNKNQAYSRILDWRALVEANNDFLNFQIHYQSNRIFLSPDLKEKLDRIEALIKSVWIKKKLDFDGHKLSEGKSFLLEAHEKYKDEIKPIIKEIESLFQEKLFPGQGKAR